jgi:hypothetical protein
MLIFKAIILFGFGFYRIVKAEREPLLMNKIHLLWETGGTVHIHTPLDIGLAKPTLCC